jgi:hypothetical protein
MRGAVVAGEEAARAALLVGEEVVLGGREGSWEEVACCEVRRDVGIVL